MLNTYIKLEAVLNTMNIYAFNSVFKEMFQIQCFTFIDIIGIILPVEARKYVEVKKI